jgi:hypothetical protein
MTEKNIQLTRVLVYSGSEEWVRETVAKSIARPFYKLPQGSITEIVTYELPVIEVKMPKQFNLGDIVLVAYHCPTSSHYSRKAVIIELAHTVNRAKVQFIGKDTPHEQSWINLSRLTLVSED